MIEPLSTTELGTMTPGAVVFKAGFYFVRLADGWARVGSDGTLRPVGVDEVQGSMPALLSPYGPAGDAVERVRKALGYFQRPGGG